MDLPPASVEWYLVRDGKKYGPLSDLEMLNDIDAGDLRPNDQLWRKGFGGWRPAKVVFPELYGASAGSIEVGEALVCDRLVERRATSRKALVLSFSLIVILGGAVSYAYFNSGWLLSETVIFLAQFLAL
jgi:hypothetical protein